MKKRTLVVLAALLCLPLFGYAQGNRTPGEENIIRQVVRDYVDAWETRDVEKMKQVLHPRARLFLDAKKNDLAAQSPSQLYAALKSNHHSGMPPMPNGNLNIQSVDVTDGIAVVKVEIDYPRSKITQQLSLMKFESGWKIVSRVLAVNVETSQASLH